jgi:hypothetical protein
VRNDGTVGADRGVRIESDAHGTWDTLPYF